jgi:HTH-type transcriptional regulator/antitoxin HigA
LENLRSLTLKQPGEFRPRLREMMAECGVALVICPHFPKTKAQGATFWLGRDKAVLMITNRGKWADIFWFSLFHEIGHILLHGKKATILELDGDSQREEEANRFAADVLIPPRMWKEFLIQGNFYKDSVKRFAEKAGIHPGIVVGRLQKEKVIKPQWLNDLRERVDWQEQI